MTIQPTIHTSVVIDGPPGCDRFRFGQPCAQRSRHIQKKIGLLRSTRHTVCVCLPPEAIWFSLRSFHSKCTQTCHRFFLLKIRIRFQLSSQKGIAAEYKWMRVESRNTFTHLPAYATVLFGITTNAVWRTHTGIQSQQWARGMRNGTKKTRMNTRTHAHTDAVVSAWAQSSTEPGWMRYFSSVHVYRPYRAVEHILMCETQQRFVCLPIEVGKKSIINSASRRQHLCDDWYRH